MLATCRATIRAELGSKLLLTTMALIFGQRSSDSNPGLERTEARFEDDRGTGCPKGFRLGFVDVVEENDWPGRVRADGITASGPNVDAPSRGVSGAQEAGQPLDTCSRN